MSSYSSSADAAARRGAAAFTLVTSSVATLRRLHLRTLHTLHTFVDAFDPARREGGRRGGAASTVDRRRCVDSERSGVRWMMMNPAVTMGASLGASRAASLSMSLAAV